MEPGSLRKRVARLYRFFAERGLPSPIENVPWSGYRLDPRRVRIISLAEIGPHAYCPPELAAQASRGLELPPRDYLG